MSNNEINRTSFVIHLVTKYHELDLINKAKSDSLSDLELYIIDSFFKSNRIDATLQLLNISIKCLLKFHPQFNKRLNLNKLTEDDAKEIQYHIENFYFRITKVKDQILLLINHIFELKLKNKDCTYDKVSKAIEKRVKSKTGDKIYVQEMLLSLSIQDYKDKFKEVDNYRNYIVHRGEYIDDDLNLVSSVLYFRDLEKTRKYPNDLFERTMQNDELKDFLKVAVFKRAFQFRKMSDALKIWVIDLYELIDIEFEIKIKEKMLNP